MFINLLMGTLVILAVAVIMGLVSMRAWRAKNLLLRWVSGLLSSLLTLMVTLVGVLALVGLYKANAPRNVQVPDLTVAGTPEQVQRGEHLANSFCASCHSLDGQLPLTGGMDLGNDFPMDLGTYISSNLTPAGTLKDWTDGEIFRALRNGIDKDGRWLAIMSNARGRYLSDEDLEAVIAYLRSQPAAGNETQDPPDQPNMLAAIMLGAGMIPGGPPPIEGEISSPALSATVEYGEYILSYQDCRVCHGEDLKGGVQGQLAPIGPPLDMVKSWTQEEFITTFRTGVDPSGHKISEVMPWKFVSRMSDEELTAMYLYMTSLP